jgi:DNA polymerase-3 subunit gamma/tau
MVYYRQYRPQKIDDLDNAQVRSTLQSLFLTSLKESAKKNKTPDPGDAVSHAFLFTGPKGLGKTSAARIIAKVVNCRGKDRLGGYEPCNACEQCNSINNGTNMDVLEIDAASNRGIDEIRELKEKIRLTPLSAKKKVYIIDEVHMLTTEAFNALLKTLEEPPAHAMFILCTTEPHKIPSTILSRCFHLSYHLATTEELARSFGRIVQGEKLDVEEDALLQIAHLADGGFRDGAKVLEEIVSLANGQKITKQFVEDRYKVTSITQQVDEMFKALAVHDARKGIEIISNLTQLGVDMKYYIQQLMEALHIQLLAQLGSGKQTMKVTDIKRMFELFSKAYAEMRYAVLPQLPLELAVIEWCNIDEPKGTKGTDETEEIENTAPMAQQKEEVTVHTLRKHVGDMNRKKVLYGDTEDKLPPEDLQKIKTETIELLHAHANGEVTKEWLGILWSSLLTELKQYNHTIAGVLRSCAIKSYTKDKLIIETAYAFHKERLGDQRTINELTRICKLLTGNAMVVEVELKR